MLSVQKHKSRVKRGEFFPPFLYVSVINTCNLRCQGCWVDVSAKQERISPEAFHRLVAEAKEMGNVFFGIVGGEPFLHPELLDSMLAAHPDCYFQIFTHWPVHHPRHRQADAASSATCRRSPSASRGPRPSA